MRRLVFDNYEFDGPEGEETLELAVSSPRQHATVGAFLEACGASARNGTTPPVGWTRWAEIAAEVRIRAGLELPEIEACEVSLISDDWDDVEVAVAVGSILLWYHWWTTA